MRLHSRVDLYDVDGEVWSGELTPTRGWLVRFDRELDRVPGGYSALPRRADVRAR